MFSRLASTRGATTVRGSVGMGLGIAGPAPRGGALVLSFGKLMSDRPVPIPRTALPQDVLRAVVEAIDRGRRVVVASVVSRHGSSPSTPGQKLALFDDGLAFGTIGGGAVERAVLAGMAAALDDPSSAPRVETFRLGAELGMCCGGSVDILIEPL